MSIHNNKYICNQDMCTGCMLCQTVCIHNGIDIKKNEEGFFYPSINANCIQCGKCEKVCPAVINEEVNLKTQEIYAMRSCDENILHSSASGGIFSTIAIRFMAEGNYICAARWDDDYTNVYHDITNNIDELKYYRGSKYVQSSMQGVYKKISTLLQDTDACILFCGTPCQTAAVKQYLKSWNFSDRVILCDILCFGVSSNLIFEHYRNYLIEKYNSPIKEVNFRSKKNGWCNYSIEIIFENHETYIAGKFDDPFYRGYLKQYFSRLSCYNCKFACLSRQSDITLGDFWGAKEGYYNFYGVSIVSISTQKGKVLIDELTKEKKFKRAPISIDMIVPYNKRFIDGRSEIPNERRKFFKELEAEGFDYIHKKYLKPEDSKIKNDFIKRNLERKEKETVF